MGVRAGKMWGRMFGVFMAVGVVSGNEPILAGAQSAPSDVSPTQKDINQWNIVQQVGQQPSSAPGFVWIQVPITNVHQVAGGNNNFQVQETGEGGGNAGQSNSQGQGKPPGFVVIEGGSAQDPAAAQGPAEAQSPAALLPSGGHFNGECLKPRGQFPSKTCNTFVNCWDGSATEQECPGGLLFSSSKGYCDFAEQVDCGGRPIVPGSPPPTSISGGVTAPHESSAGQSSAGATSGEATTPTTLASTVGPTAATLPPVDPELKKYCLKPRGQFPSRACNKFVNCWDGNVIEQECPEGLLFSVKGYCDYASNVKCGDISSFENTIPDVTKCPLESGTFRDESDCGSYYTCVGNKEVAKFECPKGFKFSDHIGVCDYEDRVDCSKKPVIYQRAVNTDPAASKYEGSNVECPVEFGAYRDKTNCGSYYTCVSYKIVAKHDCPSGFLYNDEIGICDYPNTVDCNKTPNVFQRNNHFVPQLPEAYMDKIKSCTPGTVLRLNPQCSAACLCRNGVAEIIQCPAGTSYDSSSDKCVSPHLARC